MSIIMTCIVQMKPSEVISSLQVTTNKLAKPWISGEVESHFGFWPLFVCFLSLSNVSCLFLRLYLWFSPFGYRISHVLAVLSQDPTVTEQKLCALNYRKVICSCTIMFHYSLWLQLVHHCTVCGVATPHSLTYSSRIYGVPTLYLPSIQRIRFNLGPWAIKQVINYRGWKVIQNMLSKNNRIKWETDGKELSRKSSNIWKLNSVLLIIYASKKKL